MDSLLYEALASDFGIKVLTAEPLVLRARLYVERKKQPIFESLSFVLSPTDPDNELWIVKKSVPDEQEL